MGRLGLPVSSSFLFSAIVGVCLTLVVFIVMVGGVVCVKDPHYSFSEYLSDLSGVYKLLGAAVAAAFGRSWLERRNGSNGKKE